MHDEPRLLRDQAIIDRSDRFPTPVTNEKIPTIPFIEEHKKDHVVFV